MRRTFTLALLIIICPMLYTQVAPSATTGRASLSYSVRYAEMAESGGTLGDWHTITPSAYLDYSNGGRRFPFSMEYAGGYTSTVSGPSYTTGAFQHLVMSQAISHGKWKLAMSDDISYRPQAPSTGFSGIPGTGEPIGGVSEGAPSQIIFTVNTHALENASQGELRRLLSYRSTIFATAGYDILHYPESDASDSRTAMTSAGIDFRLDGRNSLTTRYAFTRISYPGYRFQITTNSFTLGLAKSWTRSLRTNAAAGPEWVNGSNNLMSSTTELTAQGGLSYQRRRTSIGLSYSRAIDAGSGYMIGSIYDDISAGLSRPFSRTAVFEMNGGFRYTSELAGRWDVSGAYGGIQASWRIRRSLNAFANYTATSQSASEQVSSNVLNQMIQTFSFGIGFTKDVKPGK
jgi:hypothetical protein